ncbi:hypothetical protein SDC9_188636 [bioreactor metagenome]|uniref:Uncharacterized protein n=1 Tax=bioreactor metagenome TaxID=1076179 RepID=A0A645HPW0_9ZZZZ
MCKQRITAVNDVSYRIHLMLAERDFRVDTDKIQMAAVILTDTVRIEFIIIQTAELFTAVRIIPYPILKSSFNQFLFALCNGCFFFVQNRCALSVFIFHIVKDTDIT